MVKIRFRSNCPACTNETVYYWIHHKCDGDLDMDDNANLICSRCGVSSFIFQWKFDCGNRNNGFHKAGFEYGCKQGFFACLSNLSKIENPPTGFIVKITEILLSRMNELKEAYK